MRTRLISMRLGLGTALTFGGLCLSLGSAHADDSCQTADVAACAAGCEDSDAASCARLYKTACDAGEMWTCSRLGNMHAAGRGVAKNEKLAATLFDKACRGDEPWACGALAHAYVSGQGVHKDTERATTLFQRACDLERTESCVDLAVLFAEGEEGFVEDHPRAVALAKRACDLKDAVGCFRLALAYDSGEGVGKDQALAARLYEQSCESGFSGACVNLADALEHGEGVAKDLARSTALYSKGCEGEDSVGCFCAGEAYVLGRGVAKDLERGAKLFEQSCALGFKESCRRAGVGLKEFVGLWSAAQEGVDVQALLLPAGRYTLALTVGGSELKETGRYYLEKGKLVLANASGEKTTYDVDRSSGSMTWKRIGGKKRTLELALEKGSRDRVTDLGMQMEATAGKEDEAWKERIKLGRSTPMPGFSMEDVPRDPNPGKIFRDQEVYAEIQLYAHTPEAHVLDVLDLEAAPAHGTTSYAYFLPSGRFALVEVPDPSAKKPRQKAVWGAYSVEPDSLTIQIDGKGKGGALLFDGRRTIAWGDDRLFSLVSGDTSDRPPEPARPAEEAKPEPTPPKSTEAPPAATTQERKRKTVELEMEEMMDEMQGEIERRRR